MKANATFPQQYLEKMLHTEDQNLKKLHELVSDALKEEDLIVKNLMDQSKESSTTGQRIADQVASFGGSWTFIPRSFTLA